MNWFYWVLVGMLSWACLSAIYALTKDEIKTLSRVDIAVDLAIGIFLLIGCLLWL